MAEDAAESGGPKGPPNLVVLQIGAERPLSYFARLSLRDQITFARPRYHIGLFHDHLDLVKSGSVSLRRGVIGESVSASQFIERLIQDLSKSGLRFELERSPAGGVGDFGEELAIRAVTTFPKPAKGTPRTFPLGFEAGGVNLRPAPLSFLDDLLRVLDRPLLRKIAIN